MIIGDVRIGTSPYTLNTLSSLMFFILLGKKKMTNVRVEKKKKKDNEKRTDKIKFQMFMKQTIDDFFLSYGFINRLMTNFWHSIKKNRIKKEKKTVSCTIVILLSWTAQINRRMNLWILAFILILSISSLIHIVLFAYIVAGVWLNNNINTIMNMNHQDFYYWFLMWI